MSFERMDKNLQALKQIGAKLVGEELPYRRNGGASIREQRREHLKVEIRRRNARRGRSESQCIK